MAETFGMEIFASNKRFFSGRARSLAIPAADGERVFLAHHSNMVCAIIPGEMRFEDESGQKDCGCRELRFCGDDRIDRVKDFAFP